MQDISETYHRKKTMTHWEKVDLAERLDRIEDKLDATNLGLRKLLEFLNGDDEDDEDVPELLFGPAAAEERKEHAERHE